MGFIPEMTSEHGNYSIEVRRESFYLYGKDGSEIFVYPSGEGHGNIELLLEDIDKLRACLDLAEFHSVGSRGKDVYEGIISHFEIKLDGKIEAIVRTQDQADKIVKALEFEGLSPSIHPQELFRSARVVKALLDQEQREQDLERKRQQAKFDLIVDAFVHDMDVKASDDSTSKTGQISSVDKVNRSFVVEGTRFYLEESDVELI